jgi:glycosyltransferase involved in cell wall biosynthesis
MSNGSTWRVGVNAHLLSRQASYRSAGVHGYIFNLLRNLPAVEEGSNLRYSVFVGEGQLHETGPLTLVRSRWPTGRPVVRILWEQLALPWAKLDLLHTAAFVSPLVPPAPTVVTVYDLSFLHCPTAFGRGRRAYLHLMTRLSCRRARRIIAISESTRRDLVKQWGIPPSRILVAYPGVGEQYRPLPAEEVKAFRAKRGLPEQFVLHLGTLQPRKNLVRLIQAYHRLRPEGAAVKLVLAGGKGWSYYPIMAEIESMDLRSDVLLPGYVAAEELPLWYNAATVLAYPSLYEGFGLPVVEAMACQTPVVTSAASSLSEAAGDAALLVDPHDTEALADALHRALTNDSLRREMKARGRQQASKFSWQQTAADTVAAYHSALSGEA